MLEEKKRAVDELLAELELGDIPRLLVLNKVDLLPAGEARNLAERLGGVAVSATRRQGLKDLIAAAETELCRREPLLKDYGAGVDRRVN